MTAGQAGPRDRTNVRSGWTSSAIACCIPSEAKLKWSGRIIAQRMLLLSNCFLGHFEVVAESSDSFAAVTLEKKALLYAFFVVFAAVMARVFTRDLFVSVVSQNLRFDSRQSVLSSSPNQKSCG